MKKSLAFATVAAVLAAPVFAQSNVQSSSALPVTSGTGIVVTPGAPLTQALPGAVNSGISSSSTTTTSVAGAGPAPSSTATTTTTVTRYWVNVPPGVENDPTFQRWMHLK